MIIFEKNGRNIHLYLTVGSRCFYSRQGRYTECNEYLIAKLLFVQIFSTEPLISFCFHNTFEKSSLLLIFVFNLTTKLIIRLGLCWLHKTEQKEVQINIWQTMIVEWRATKNKVDWLAKHPFVYSVFPQLFLNWTIKVKSMGSFKVKKILRYNNSDNSTKSV